MTKGAFIFEVRLRLENLGFYNVESHMDPVHSGTWLQMSRNVMNKSGVPKKMTFSQFVIDEFISAHSVDEVTDMLVGKRNKELKRKRIGDDRPPMSTGERTGFYL